MGFKLPIVLKSVVQVRRAMIYDTGLRETEVFRDFGTPIRAKKTDISDGERWRAAQVSAQISARFIVRGTAFTRAILHSDKFFCGGIDYDITGIKEVPDLDGRFLEISAVAVIRGPA
jgi:head-tail adaptor